MTSSSLRAAVFLCMIALTTGGVVKRALGGSAMKLVCKHIADVNCATPRETALSCTKEAVNLPRKVIFETGCSTFEKNVVPHEAPRAWSKLTLSGSKYYQCTCSRLVGSAGLQCSCQYTEDQHLEILRRPKFEYK
ncbi:uncharacterized protein LOC101858945 [Aplysia californica]|uniref:Uncharacterized protein LOC101858945 n=1 Tax=Aplysia californica TaxID=6500 RepID=A0ABM0JS05_APLCA|nr:uncharacterized protein LOC101858945 [Aplysia californica]